MLLDKLGGNIRYYRKKMGWTQQELARRINVSRPVLTKWENGKSTPDLNALIKLSQVFNSSVDALLGNFQHKHMLIREAKKMYHIEGHADEEMLEIIRYLQAHQEFKTGLYSLSRISPRKRKPIEKLLKIALHDLLEMTR